MEKLQGMLKLLAEDMTGGAKKKQRKRRHKERNSSQKNENRKQMVNVKLVPLNDKGDIEDY